MIPLRRPKHLLNSIFLSFAMLLMAARLHAQCPMPVHPDYNALMALYNTTNGPGWLNNTGWAGGAAGTNCDPCSGWYGVQCNGLGRVTRIDLDGLEDGLALGADDDPYGNNLSGFLPDLDLPFLEVLSLHDNNFSGSSFPNISAPNLISIGIGHTQMSGTLPAFNFPNLQYLAICCNNFFGPIPAINCPNLIGLYLQDNNLTGSIPDALGSLTSLNILNLSVNQLSGCIPAGLQNLCATITNGNLLGNLDLDTQSWADFCNTQAGMCASCTPPSIFPASPLRECFGFFVLFDLTQANPQLIGGVSGLSVNWYRDAAATQSISDPTAFFSSGNDETVYARTFDGLCESDVIMPVSLILLPNPFVDPAVDLSSPICTNTILPVSANIQGGTPPYSGDFSIAGQVIPFSNFNGGTFIFPLNISTPGVYDYTVIDFPRVVDANGCTNFTDIILTRTLVVEATPAPFFISSDAPMCAGGTRELITSETGGSFNVIGGPGFVVGNTLFTTGPGTVLLEYILNVNNCQGTATQSIPVNPPPVLTCTQQNPVSTPAGSNGSATVQISGGAAGYSIAWSGVANGSQNQASAGTATITGLIAGNYNVTVTDVNGCEQSCAFSISTSGGSSCTHPDYAALMALYNSTNGPGWTNNSGWVEGAAGTSCDPCTWYGIECDGDGRIICLHLDGLAGGCAFIIGPGNNLAGTIPSEIGNLSRLQFLSLHGNQLTGPIPSQIGNLSQLEALGLFNNQLNGNIPATLGNLSNLKWLNLSNNQLNGSIPSELGNIPGLLELRLNDNLLSGCIPASLQNLCPMVTNGNLSNNAALASQSWSNFCNAQAGVCTSSTSCPTDSLALVALYNATNGPGWTNRWNLGQPMSTWYGVQLNAQGCVECIDMDGTLDCRWSANPQTNGLSGSLPDLNLPMLKALVLPQNNLTGSIPNFNLPELEWLSLENNSLSGTIPNFNLPNLQQLRLDANQLSGSLPNFNLPALQQLSASSNQLSGIIPPFNLPVLNRLWLHNNQLTGSIPIFNTPLIMDLSLGINSLSGSIPGFNYPNLTQLHLNDNELSGTIPNFQLPFLQVLTLAQNELSGSVPAFNLPYLQSLYLENNQLSGGIPDFNLPAITRIHLENNQLTGCFPVSILTLCPLGFSSQVGNNGYNFTNNPALPWSGDLERFCNGETQTGASCDDGNPLTTNDMIQVNCACSGTLPPSCPTDSLALVALYNATNGPGWTNRSNWLVSGQPISNWYGVSTNAGGCVDTLHLGSNNLTGVLPSELGNLSQLKLLNLSVNNLSGGIPSSLGQLSQLELLNLSLNRLRGSLPSELGQLTQMRQFYCNQNDSLYGPIPATFAQWTLIEILNMSVNYFSGTIPPGVQNWQNLRRCFLNTNRLSGNIPAGFGQLNQLERLNLSLNQLTGSIPAALGNLPVIDSLYLNNNMLSGCIPQELLALCPLLSGASIASNPGLLTQSWGNFCNNQTGVCSASSCPSDSLALVALYNATNGPGWTNRTNWLVPGAPIHTWWGVYVNAQGCVDTLLLPGNNLSGALPAQVGSLSGLQVLNLSNNQLSGSIPASAGNLSALEILFLNNNNLNGSLPASLGNLANLRELWLFENALSGAIPAELGNLQNLVFLSIASNDLTGSIPASLGSLPALQALWLYENQLSGSIPAELGNLSQLRELSLSINQLSGSIPTTLGNLSQLTAFWCSFNNLNGSIPPVLGTLSQLTILELSFNDLMGSIPASLGSLSNLTHFYLNNNQLQGCFPPELMTHCGLGLSNDLLLPGYNLTGNTGLPGGGDFTAFCNNSSGACAPTNPDAFITTWKTDNPGTSANNQITIPGTGTGYLIEWEEVGNPANNGTAIGNNTTTVTFPTPGTYRVSISGNFTRIRFATGPVFGPIAQGDPQKLLSIEQWGNIAWNSMEQAFQGCSNMDCAAMDAPNLSGVTSMRAMFADCTAFNGAIGHWNTEAVADMSMMFRFASAFNQPIGNWNTAVVTNMSEMFLGAASFDQPIGNWNTGNVTNMSDLFLEASSFNQPIGTWNTAAVTNMSGMFLGASVFDQPIGNWNTSAVTNMNDMFIQCEAFNQPIGNWNTSNVITMRRMFSAAISFNQPIDSWNTGNVNNMVSMFYGATAFNQPIGNWNTSNVINMSEMFSLATSFNQPINNWNTQNVTDMNSMFLGASSFNQNLGDWDLSGIFSHFNCDLGDTNLCAMLDNSGLDCANYDATLAGWAANPATPDSLTLGAAGLQYGAQSARDSLVNLMGWTITGDNFDPACAPCPSYTASLGGSTSICQGQSATLTFNFVGGAGPYNVVWNNGTLSNINNGHTVSVSPTSTTTYSISSVTDAGGCPATIVGNAVITVNPLPTVGIAGTTPANCNQATGSVTLNVSGATGTPTYLWSNGATTQNLSNVAAGNYSVTVTSGNGCTATASVNVPGTNAPTVGIAGTTPANCNQPTGSVTLSVSGATGTPTYLWSNGATTQNLSNVAAGSYSVTVTSGNGCTATASATVLGTNAPTVGIAGTTPANCNQATGSVTLNVSGATGTPTYLWSNGATTQNLSNVAAGSYSVTVTSGNGCTATASANVPGTNAPTVGIANTTPANCNQATGGVTLSVSGATGTPTYLWSNGATTQNLSNVAAGSYSVTVTSGNGCTATTTAQVTGTTPPTVNIAGVLPVVCSQPNGAINISVSGATGTPSYLWSNGATSPNLAGIPIGSYTVTVTSGNGCTATATAQVTGTTAASVTVLQVTQPGCNQSNGIVVLSVTNATGTPTFLWSNGATTQNLFNLSAGLYNVTVTNGNGCTSTASADLSIAGVPAVAVSSVTPASCGLSNGSVGISVSGVSGTMQFLWSNGATTQNLNNVPAGNYTVTVTNPVNGCGATTSALVGGPMVEPFMFLCQQQAPASMPGTADGVGVISLSGGTPGYTVTWSGGTITNPNAAVILMANLTAGSYPLTATDSGGCSAECMLVIQSASSSSCRASDSLSLRALFTATGGQGWINKTNWLVAGQPISTWHGITLNAQGCVTQIRLDNNNLSGVLPNLDMSQLQLLSLSGNKLEGTLPALNTPQLRRLNLRNNRLQNIAGLSHITTWNTVVAGTGYPDVIRLDGNMLTFEDLLPDFDLLEFWRDGARYAPQDSVFTDTLIVREIGASLSIDLGFDEQVPDNDYDWIKDGQPYQMLSSNKLIFNDLKEEDAGLYYARVTNPDLPQLILYTRTILLEVRPDAGGVFNGLTPDDPNGDNCCLVVDQLSEFPDAEMRIYNRWGELVFRQQPYDNRWRGTDMNFSDLPAGTYYYLLTPNREGYKPRRGFILLWR